MFGKAQIENSNVWKRKNREFQCLEKGNSRNPMFKKGKSFGKTNNHEFDCLEKPK